MEKDMLLANSCGYLNGREVNKVTKKQLIEGLAPWPDDAKVEILVRTPKIGDCFWEKITDVEKPRTPEEIEKYKIDKNDANRHCLIITG